MKAGLTAVIVVAALIVGAMSLADHDEPAGLASSSANECSDADRVFSEEGLAPPDDYGPSCPEPDQLRADLVSAQEPVTKELSAMRRAIGAGAIEEEQNPCTYPQGLRQEIGLSDADCDGALGRVLERQFP